MRRCGRDTLQSPQTGSPGSPSPGHVYASTGASPGVCVCACVCACVHICMLCV